MVCWSVTHTHTHRRNIRDVERVRHSLWISISLRIIRIEDYKWEDYTRVNKTMNAIKTKTNPFQIEHANAGGSEQSGPRVHNLAGKVAERERKAMIMCTKQEGQNTRDKHNNQT